MKALIYLILISILIIYANSSKCSCGNSRTTTTYANCVQCIFEVGCTKCDPYYYVLNGSCKKCPNFCTICWGEDICGKCEIGSVRFRESPTRILCIKKDDRMNIDKCSMYIMGNDDFFKCVDCERGYKFNFGTNKCEPSPIRNDDMDDTL